MSGGVATIPVCWESSAAAFPAEKVWVRNIVEATFEGNWAFYIDFVGWNDCVTGSTGIRIKNWTGSGQVVALGRDLNGVPDGMSVNFTTFGAANPFCLASEPNRQRCIQSVTLHEFAHALGMAHEQNRIDTPAACTQPTQGGNGDTFVGAWDINSITNYCNPTFMPLALSPGDQAALARMYGGGGDVFVSRSTGSTFQVVEDWHPIFCVGGEECRTGDFNGDGRQDIVAFTRGAAGDVFVSLSAGNFFAGAGGQKWHEFFCQDNQTCRVGDVNGDGLDDIVAFSNDWTADVFVALSTGSSFVPGQVKWHDYFCTSGEYCDVGDITGDGKDDIVAFTRGSAADVFVSVSNGSWFVGAGGAAKWHDWFCAYAETCRLGDVNGDGKSDIVAFTNNAAADVFVSLSSGTGFVGGGGAAKWHDYFCTTNETCEVADMTGDGKADIVAVVPHQNGSVFVSRSNGSFFEGSGGGLRWANGICPPGDVCRFANVDGLNGADAVSFKR